MAEIHEALRLKGITKVYPNGVVANRDVNFSVSIGEIHALSGENGAGKTTLMKILFGEEKPTAGEIFIDGDKVNIQNPSAAIRLGIGLVHQHFMLVPSLTVTENLILGIEPVKGLRIDERKAREQVSEISKKYHLIVDPDAKVRDLTVGQKQKVEILKTLLRGVRILILDEPTAVLTPQETKELFYELKLLRSAGYTIIFISHKLNEVKELCDRITIIRHGQTVGVFQVDSVSEDEISRMMVGRSVKLKIEKGPAHPGPAAIKVRGLTVLDDSGKSKLRDVSFMARRGEIFGVAGVEGNGQAQLADALTGMGAYQSGTIEINGLNISGKTVREIRDQKLSHIPEDRMKTGIAPRLSIENNVITDKIFRKEFNRFGFLDLKRISAYGLEMVKRFRVFCQSAQVHVNSLSGGNIQKVVLAREISSDPDVIIANQPTRGVDVGATEFIRQELIKMRNCGKTVFLISSDLGEILGLSDSLIVLYEGAITAYFPDASMVTEDELGRYMLGVQKQSEMEIRMANHE
ncbi:ABC transporter ATP-binding protein [Anaerolineaceae bacterium oral taxon 439]|nr:ABC transporter ATP-binding protein [Anaerolineaceae bacterium oral taxon 439]